MHSSCTQTRKQHCHYYSTPKVWGGGGGGECSHANAFMWLVVDLG